LPRFFSKKRVLSCLAFLLFISPTFASTGIRALDEPAIAAKAPDRVALIAIARAGDRLVSVGEHGVIIYSDDNGLTWRQASVPVTVTLTCVAFANAHEGWAAGHYGVILHTTDAGATWVMQLDGIQANQLTLAAANQSVAQTNDSDFSQHAVRRANFFVAAGPDKPFLSILVKDAQNIMIFGAYRMVMRTEDGGKTWQDWSLHIADPLSHNLYDITPAGTDLFIAGEIGLVYRSTDGGQNFTQTTPPSNATMLGAVAAGAKSLVVFGIAGQAYRSDDSGQSWVTLPFNTGANLTAGHVLGNGALLITGEDGMLYFSKNHGQSFQPLPEVEPMALYDFAQAANGDVVTVGNLGVAHLPAADFVTQ
jgi:photosystem II stability/assembly factor-like uncharacterized protein